MDARRVGCVRGCIMRLGISNLQQLARELQWRARCSSPNAAPLTYPVSREEAGQCAIHWPDKLQWAPGEAFVHHIRTALSNIVKLEIRSIPQPYEGIVVFHFVRNGSVFPIVLDYSDYAERIDANARKMAALYMKMQYRIGGYGTADGVANIRPGGYTVPNEHAYCYIPPARQYANRAPAHDVYGRYSLQFATGIRKQAITLLSQQHAFEYFGGAGLVRYSQHLIDAASSKVCVDLPGNGPFCFRLLDYFAVGACIVAVRHTAEFAVPLIPGVHIAYVKDDLSDLVGLCRYYTENEQARRAMQSNAREYFDRYLHRTQLAAYYLQCCLEATNGTIGSAPSSGQALPPYGS